MKGWLTEENIKYLVVGSLSDRLTSKTTFVKD